MGSCIERPLAGRQVEYSALSKCSIFNAQWSMTGRTVFSRGQMVLFENCRWSASSTSVQKAVAIISRASDQQGPTLNIEHFSS